jgi:hypothetical protein
LICVEDTAVPARLMGVAGEVMSGGGHDVLLVNM